MTDIVEPARCVVMVSEQVRARRVVLQRALDDADAAELLAMLGLDDVDDARQDGPVSGVRSGGVHALSAATEARLAATADPVPVVVPAPRPAAAPSPARPRPAGDRRCEGCGTPVVQQTRYRLDPAGYQQRGIKLLAAKGRCHACYYRLRHPAAAKVAERKNPGRKAGPAQQLAENVAIEPAASDDEVGRWALALVLANRELAETRAELTRQRDLNVVDVAAEVTANVADALEERDAARAECGRLAGLLEEATARIAEMQRQVEDVIATWSGYRGGGR